MPLVRIELDSDLNDRLRDRIGEEVHAAQVETLDIPEDDKFQVFTPHAPGELRFDPHYNGVDRQSLLVIHITLVRIYSVATKQRLFRAIVERLGQLGIRPDDVLIALAENSYEDWFGGRFA